LFEISSQIFSIQLNNSFVAVVRVQGLELSVGQGDEGNVMVSMYGPSQ